MLVIRHLYIYLVTFISLLMLLAGVSNLLRLLLSLGLEPSGYPISSESFRREQFSLWGAILVVGGIVWTIHWLLAQRQIHSTRPGAAQEERQAIQRKLLIYTTLFITGWQVFFALSGIIQNLLIVLLVDSNQNYGNGGGVISGQISVLLVYSLAWLYYWRVRQADCAAAPEQKGGATLRRWYFYLACYGTLSVALYALADLARYLWQMLSTEVSQNVTSYGRYGPIASDIGFILAGLVAWYWHWRWSQRLMADSQQEQRATLPQFYLYAVILQMVSVTLSSLSLFIYNLLRLLIGTPPQSYNEPLPRTAGSAFLFALVYGLAWAYHRRVIHRQAGSGLEQPHQAGLRNLYYYLVSLISLWVMAFGAAWLIRLLIDFWAAEATTRTLTLRGWGDQISLFVTLIMVGGPLWYLNWRRLQRQALTGDGTARQSVVRRIYIYLVLFISVLTLLVGVAFLVYKIFLGFGADSNSSRAGDLSWAIGASITALVALVYHLRVMRSDHLARSNIPEIASDDAVVLSGNETPLSAHLILVWGEGSDLGKVQSALDKLKETLPNGWQAAYFTANSLAPEELNAWLLGRKLPPYTPTSPSSPV